MNQDSVTAKSIDNGYALCYVTYVMLIYGIYVYLC